MDFRGGETSKYTADETSGFADCCETARHGDTSVKNKSSLNFMPGYYEIARLMTNLPISPLHAFLIT